MKKTIIAGFLCLILITLSVIPCYAYAGDSTLQPMWDNIAAIDLQITFNGTNGTASVTASKKTGVTSMEGTLTVYENIGGSWEYVDSNSGSTTRNSLAVTVEFEAVSGREYKAVFEVTAYKNDVGESDSSTSYKTCP